MFIKRLQHISKRHLVQNNITYYKHLRFSLNNSIIMFKGGIKGILHGIFPGLYETFTKDTIDKLNKRMQIQINENKKKEIIN